MNLMNIVSILAALVAVTAALVSLYWTKRSWQSLASTERALAATDRSLSSTARTAELRDDRRASAARHEELAAKYDRRAWPLKPRSRAA